MLVGQHDVQWIRTTMACLVAGALAACGGGGGDGAPAATAGSAADATADGSASVRGAEKLAAFAQTATVAQGYAAGNITLPAGLATIGSAAARAVWVSDHFSGFCALKADGQPITLDTAKCVDGAVSPGQPAVQTNVDGSYTVYVPDNSSKGSAIWRYRFTADGVEDTRYRPVQVAPAVNRAPNFYNTAPRVTAIALSPKDGSLLVVYGRDPRVVKIKDPSGFTMDTSLRPQVGTFEQPGPTATPTAFVVGRAVEAVGPASISFVDGNLYLAEPIGVSVLENVGLGTYVEPTTPPTARNLAPALNIPSPTAVYAPTFADGDTRHLFIADGGNVYRFNFDPACARTAGGRLDVFAKGGPQGHDFRNITALTGARESNGSLTLWVADDESSGEVENDGRVFMASDALSPSKGSELSKDCAQQAQPVVPAPAQGPYAGRLLLSGNVTSPGAIVTTTLPNSSTSVTWVSDHVRGVCRVERMAADPANGYCVLGGASPGGMAYDKDRGFLYIADSSSNTGSVVRFSVNDDGTLGARTNPAKGSTLRFTHRSIRDNGVSSLAIDKATKTLYMGFKRTDGIARLNDPGSVPVNIGATATNTTQATTIGRVARGKGPFSMTVAGRVLYLAEPKGLTQINLAACSSNCQASPTPAGIGEPTYVISDDQVFTASGAPLVPDFRYYNVYVSTATGLYKYAAPERADISAPSAQLHAASGFGSDRQPSVALANVGAIGLGSDGNMLLADDPTNGANNGARIWNLEKNPLTP